MPPLHYPAALSYSDPYSQQEARLPSTGPRALTGQAGKPQVSCIPCGRQFASQGALQMHQSSSATHKNHQSFCTPCNRQFISAEALQAHRNDSTAHKYPQQQQNVERSQQRQPPSTPTAQEAASQDSKLIESLKTAFTTAAKQGNSEVMLAVTGMLNEYASQPVFAANPSTVAAATSRPMVAKPSKIQAMPRPSNPAPRTPKRQGRGGGFKSQMEERGQHAQIPLSTVPQLAAKTEPGSTIHPASLRWTRETDFVPSQPAQRKPVIARGHSGVYKDQTKGGPHIQASLPTTREPAATYEVAPILLTSAELYCQACDEHFFSFDPLGKHACDL